MRLTAVQWLVIAAAAAMFVAAILDIADVIAPPNWVWVAVPLVLWAVSRAVLPTMKQLRRANRRHG